MDRCQGVDAQITPKIMEFPCPKCGAELEMFSTDEKVVCQCGEVVMNDANKPLSV